MRKNTLSVLSGNIETTDETNKGVSIIVIDKVKPGYSLYGRIRTRNAAELNYLTPHAFWNISDSGAKCEKCETINTITLKDGDLKKGT